MGFFGKVGRAIVREHGNLAGAHHVAVGYKAIQRNWWRATKQACPKCESGHLFPITETVDGKEHRALGCNVCDYYSLMADASVQASESVPEMLRGQYEQTLAALDQPGVREARLHYFRRLSRVWYAIAALCLAVAIGFLVVSPKGIGSLAASMVGVLMFARGMRACYRHWQISENRFFIPGSFRHWLKQGVWFV
ncbi:hypothetical protein [Ralstonia sp. ASV6]|uniref:hypothetical protein n=1 Tax=Ralstonia sp. ASV6 TaxID=2795124 RepID=UPI0018ECC81F|nr:hypothetical protein [Ralstonia sp. ASV6]